jgi:hypothetical protein
MDDIDEMSLERMIERRGHRMDAKRYGVKLGVVAIVCCGSFMSVQAQTVERDTTVTGPRGRSIERQVEIQRKPGSIDRQVQITRPGGTITRQTEILRSPVGPPRRGPLIAGPWPRPAWFPRPLVIGQPAPAFGFGLLAAPMLNFSFGGGGGGMMGGAGGMGGPPGPAGPGAAPPPPPDQVALMTQRLQSFYSNNRKEAAYTLGQLGDPRAVPALVHVVKYDSSRDVRIAAAIGLGEIGGPEAAIALERASIYDRRDEVKKASATALNRLNAKAKAAPSLPPQAGRPAAAPPAPDPRGSSPFREQPNAAAPLPEAPRSDKAPWQGQSEPAPPSEPPPPPSPVTGPQNP